MTSESSAPKKEPLSPETKAKNLPKFKSVLKPSSQSKSDKKPVSIDPPSLDPLKPSGKFAASANTADDSPLDPQLRLFRRGGNTDGDRSGGERLLNRPAHSKPTFKQVIPPKLSSPSRNSANSSKQDLMDLLNKEDFTRSDLQIDDKEDLKLPGLAVTLIEHQQHGVKFMSAREDLKEGARGGLLADDMGLGKTVQSIALILNRPPPKDSKTKTTLVIAPLAVLDQWKAEINAMAPDLTVTTHHGQHRVKDAKKLHSHDVVITTYDVVRSESEKGDDQPRVLFDRQWYRIIADEAHVFRSQKSKIFKAMSALPSDGRRWVLTGTPIHNKIEDLYPLFSFFGVPVLSDEGEFFRATREKDFVTIRRVLHSVMLRRTQEILEKTLPPMTKFRRPVTLSKEELKIYSKAYHFYGRQMVVLFQRLRQACDGINFQESFVANHAELSGNDSRSSVNAHANVNANASDEFGLEEDNEDPLELMMSRMSLKSESGDYPFKDNCKVKAVRDILMEDRGRKTVIFSSFVRVLAQLKPMLDAEGFGNLVYYGQSKPHERRAILADFKDPKKNVDVLLCSLQAAAVGLNLVSASQVIMVDPWWNPQIVDQAIKRVHRLGQTKPVRCIELYAKDLFESRVINVQDRKRKLAKSLLSVASKLSDTEKDYLLTENDNVLYQLEKIWKKLSDAERNEEAEHNEEDGNTKKEPEAKPRPEAQSQSNEKRDDGLQIRKPRSKDLQESLANLSLKTAKPDPSTKSQRVFSGKHIRFDD